MNSERLMRPRLNDRLSRAAEYPVVLIVAPAGFGKSVALRDFLTSARVEAVRFEVRREENTLLAFARRFSEVVAPIVPSAAASFAELQAKVLAASEPPRLVCDWFAEHFKRTIGTIVVDDLHYAAEDPDAVAFLAEFVDRTAGRIRWILASRSDAGLPVATWLAYGRMDLPVDQNELRFSFEEALAAAQAEGMNAGAEEVRALCDSTEGWPVAFAIALRTHAQAADLRAAATRELIYRYLAEQVYARVSPSQREFLLATSVFSSFDTTAAQALGGTAEFIADLRHGVAFLSETGPGHYRYHDLFREYLESELLRRGDEARRHALSTGARLLEERGNVVEALALYTKAKDAEPIQRMLERDGFALFERGQADTLAAALDALPDELRRERPAVLGLQATLEAARGRFDAASPSFVAAIERAARKDLRLALIQRYAIELVRHGQDCIALLEPLRYDEGIAPATRVALLGTLATAYVRAQRSEEAAATITSALEYVDPSVGDDARARLYQQAAFVYSQTGDYDRVRRYAAHSVELALARNLYDVAARAYSALYVAAYDETDDPIACLAILDKLLDCARKGASTQGRLYGLLASYGIEADRGNEEGLERIEAQLADIPGMLAQNRSEVLLPGMALRAAWHGEFRRAWDLLRDSSEQQNDERAAEYYAEVALYACAAGMRDEADAANEAAVAALARWSRPTRRALRAQLLLAFYELLRGRAAAAHRLLTQVKRDLAPSMSRLGAIAQCGTMLYRAALGESDRAQLSGALERLRAEQAGGIARLLEVLPFPQTAEGGYAALSATEREILQLLVAGASTRDMAERTSRSPRTIDTHVRSICKKLNCRSRRAAVALAMGSGWVQNGGY